MEIRSHYRLGDNPAPNEAESALLRDVETRIDDAIARFAAERASRVGDGAADEAEEGETGLPPGCFVKLSTRSAKDAIYEVKNGMHM